MDLLVLMVKFFGGLALLFLVGEFIGHLFRLNDYLKGDSRKSAGKHI